MDWDDLKTVLALLRAGSLSAAARALGTTQPTVGRRLDALERRLGAQLFERGLQGLRPLGEALADSLARMEEGALAVERRIAARDTGLQGAITVTSLDWLGEHVVAPIAAHFGALHPLVDLELLNEGRVFNLSRGDADVAFRFGPFEQENLVERKVADVAFGLYAAPAYLARHGMPDFDAGCAGHAVATLHRAGGLVPDVQWLHSLAPQARTVLRANGIGAQLAAAEAGQAMAVLPRVVADRRAALQRVDTPRPGPLRAVRLGVHADLRHTARVRAFIDFAVNALAARADELAPG